MTPIQPPRRLPRSRLPRERQNRPRRLRRALLTPLLAALAVLMLAVPASAQVGGLQGSAAGAASVPEADIPDLPNVSADVRLDVHHDVRIESPQAPEIDIEGRIYEVIAYSDLAASQAGEAQACGSLEANGVAAPAELASYAEVCDRLDAYALSMEASGAVQAVQLPDRSWITTPDLHREVSLDIEAQAHADTGFAEQTVGKLKAAGQATADGAKSFAGTVKAGFQAGAGFFGGLF